MSGIVRKLWCCGAKGFPSSAEDDQDHEAAQPPAAEGHIRVYVGKDNIQCKFEMEAHFLNHPLFEDLLRLSEQEHGYSYDGALRIACEIHLFQYLLHLLKTGNPTAHYMQLPDLISNFHSTTAHHKYPPSPPLNIPPCQYSH
ncbi:unnamed protein product [Dovyalis caffra]|uniref:Small auxin up regulated protein n=1 Tax=Dovyalis caffra TaxID=77055 RepID=A0AAV1S4U4_9ROSI|nr:unnamed protein product [Dovyalis caffra]